MNWHHWYWWTWPAGIAIGVTWTVVWFYVIPPRLPLPRWLSRATGRSS